MEVDVIGSSSIKLLGVEKIITFKLLVVALD